MNTQAASHALLAARSPKAASVSWTPSIQRGKCASTTRRVIAQPENGGFRLELTGKMIRTDVTSQKGGSRSA